MPFTATLSKRQKKKTRPFSPWYIPSLIPLPHSHFFGSILFSWLTVLGQLSVVKPGTSCIVTDRTPTSLISNRRRHRLCSCLMENLGFVGKLTLTLLKNPTHMTWFGCSLPLGNDHHNHWLTPSSYINQSRNVQTGNWSVSVEGSVSTHVEDPTVKAVALTRNKWCVTMYWEWLRIVGLGQTTIKPLGIPKVLICMLTWWNMFELFWNSFNTC